MFHFLNHLWEYLAKFRHTSFLEAAPHEHLNVFEKGLREIVNKKNEPEKWML